MAPFVSNVDALIARAEGRGRASAMNARPRLRTVILTCMDARIDPAQLFGLKPGEAHILRNAGAWATPDVLRSLAVSQTLLGTTEVLVLAHTQCGLLGQTEKELARLVEAASGHPPNARMGSFQDLDTAVRESVEAIRSCTFLAHRDLVRGYVLDVEDGTVHELGEPARSDKAVPTSRSSALASNPLRTDVLSLKRGVDRRR